MKLFTFLFALAFAAPISIRVILVGKHHDSKAVHSKSNISALIKPLLSMMMLQSFMHSLISHSRHPTTSTATNSHLLNSKNEKSRQFLVQ